MKTLQEQLQKGFKLLNDGKILDAEKMAKKILKKANNNTHALYLMGVCLHKRKRLKDAAEYFERSYRAAPNNPAALAGKAVVEMDRGRNEDAVDALRKALKLDRDSPPLLSNLAICLRAMGRSDEAVATWRRCIKVAPGFIDAYYNLAETFDLRGEYEEANDTYLAATRIKPDIERPWLLLATFELKHIRIDDAKVHTQRALEIAPNSTLANATMMQICSIQGDTAEALKLAHAILERRPSHLGALNTILDLETPQSEEQQAEQERLIERSVEIIEKVDDNLDNLGLIEDRVFSEFNKAAFFDRIKRYDKAGEAYLKANDFKKRTLESLGSSYDAAHVDNYVEETKIRLNRGDVEKIAIGSDDERPVFIVGMPRSGTSLMEQIIASHPQADGIGEGVGVQSIVKDFGAGRGVRARIDWWDAAIRNPEIMPEMAEAYLNVMRGISTKTDAIRVVDKNPFNFLFTGLILRLFPKATIFWTVRNADDVALSIFTQNFSSSFAFDTDPEALWHFYEAQNKLRDLYRAAFPDRIKIIEYEELVSKPAETVAFMLDSIGLAWDDACMSFHKTKRNMATASYIQVRKQISTKSVNRADRYRTGLAPLFEARKTASLAGG